MRISLIVVAVLICFAALAAAQTVVPESYDVRFFMGGTGPIQVTPFLASAAACNLAPPDAPTATVLNPRVLYWSDVANPGRFCRYDFTTAGAGNPIPALPVGTFVARMTASASGLTSPESADSNPFSRLDALPAPTAVQVVQ